MPGQFLSDSCFLRRSLIVVFLAAIALRLLVFGFQLQQRETASLNSATPDVSVYHEAAVEIREQLNYDSRGVMIFGPGYPTFLAFVSIFSSSPVFAILVQIILSSISCALILILAWQLIGERRIALLAGLLGATSMCAICLANVLLSDSLFFTLIIAGMVVYIQGLQKDRLWYFLPAGILFGAAVLTRSIGLFFFVSLLITSASLIWSLPKDPQQRPLRRMSRSLLTVAIMLLIVLGWTTRDRERGDPPLALSSYIGITKIVAQTEARINEIAYDTAMVRFTEGIVALKEQKFDGNHGLAWMAHAESEFARLLLCCPGSLATTVLNNAIDNSCSEYSLFPAVLPQWESRYRKQVGNIGRVGTQYRVAVFSLAGFLMLLFKRKYGLAIILVTIYLYFAILSGFTLHQGNRIFYPGQIAWAILCSYALINIADAVLNVLRRRREKNLTA